MGKSQGAAFRAHHEEIPRRSRGYWKIISKSTSRYYFKNTESILREQVVEFTVTESESGERLDRLLATRYPRFSRDIWQSRIERKEVSINGNTAKSSRRVKEDETVRFTFERDEEPSVNRDYSILHEDHDILVIDKPPNLPVHPTGPYHKNTLTEILREERKDLTTIATIHRLDRETSGTIVLGKNRDAARFLTDEFKASRVEKKYRVIVEGEFPEYVDANGYLSPGGGESVEKKRKFSWQGEHPLAEISHTEFRLIQHCGPVSLVDVSLHTGRMHQIRATLFSLGYPVTGDRIYGLDENIFLRFLSDSETEADRKLMRIGRTALHSTSLRLRHPASKEYMTFISKLPQDIESLCKADFLADAAE